MKSKKDKEKKQLLPLFLLSLVFYGGILFLTFNALDIRNARLPQVTAFRLTKQEFDYIATLPSGQTIQTTSKFLAIPKEIIDYGKVFAIESVPTEDMTYYYAKEIFIPIDDRKENEQYYALADSSFREMVIFTGYELLEDGCEVYLVKEEKK